MLRFFSNMIKQHGSQAKFVYIFIFDGNKELKIRRIHGKLYMETDHKGTEDFCIKLVLSTNKNMATVMSGKCQPVVTCTKLILSTISALGCHCYITNPN